MTPGVMDRMRSRHGADRWLMPCQCPRFFCPGSSRLVVSYRYAALSCDRADTPHPRPAASACRRRRRASVTSISIRPWMMFLRRPGHDLSFTALDVRRRPPVAGDRILRAYRRRNQLIVFNNVDVNTQIEVEVAGQRSSSYSRSGGGRQERRRDLRRDPAGTQLRSVHGAPLPRHDRRSQHASPGAVPRLAGGDVEPVLVQALRWRHRPELHRHVRPRRRLGHPDRTANADDHHRRHHHETSISGRQPGASGDGRSHHLGRSRHR
jgi:hypothetical protein